MVVVAAAEPEFVLLQPVVVSYDRPRRQDFRDFPEYQIHLLFERRMILEAVDFHCPLMGLDKIPKDWEVDHHLLLWNWNEDNDYQDVTLGHKSVAVAVALLTIGLKLWGLNYLQYIHHQSMEDNVVVQDCL